MPAPDRDQAVTSPEQPHPAAASLRLPVPLDRATNAEAGTSHGLRTITWTVNQPGVVHRNRYTTAWFEIRELRAWRGEPLALRAQRRQTDGQHIRGPFTPAATQALETAVSTAVARYGFGRLWVELRRVGVVARRRGGTGSEAVAARALVDGAHVGWMTDTGQLIPLDDLLRS